MTAGEALNCEVVCHEVSPTSTLRLSSCCCGNKTDSQRTKRNHKKPFLNNVINLDDGEWLSRWDCYLPFCQPSSLKDFISSFHIAFSPLIVVDVRPFNNRFYFHCLRRQKQKFQVIKIIALGSVCTVEADASLRTLIGSRSWSNKELIEKKYLCLL